MIEAVIEGVSGAAMPVRLVLCCMRHQDPDMTSRLVRLAVKYRRYVSLLDLAGDETTNPGIPEPWARETTAAREYGLDVTVHLWETQEPQAEDIARLALYRLERLGHGVRGDRQEDRLLEVCPTSNIVTGQFASMEAHPVDRLLRAGRKVTINTDGTLFTGIDLTGEYESLWRTFGWGLAELASVNRTALSSALLPAELSESIAARIDLAYSSS